MVEFNSDFQPESNAEILAKLQYLQNFAESFSAADFVTTDPKFAAALGSMPFKLKEYLKIIAEIKTSAEEKKEERNPLKQEEERKKREEKVEKLAQEIFIISCASNKVLEQEKLGEFLDKFNLAKKLNEVGENGLSAVSATMISGKSAQEKDASLGMLLQAGAKITAQDLESLGQKKESGQENSRQREKEKNEKKPARKKLNFKEASQDQEKLEAQEIARQQQIVSAGIALDLHQSGMQILREQLKEKAQEIFKEQMKKDAAQQEEKIQIRGEKNKESQPREVNLDSSAEGRKELQKANEKKPANKIRELEKILGVPLNEKTINQLLFFSVQSGQTTFAQLLLNYGGSVDHKENGVTVFEAAIRGGNNSLISVFSGCASPETKAAAIAANPDSEKLKSLILNFELPTVGKLALKDPFNVLINENNNLLKNSETPSSQMKPSKDFQPQPLQTISLEVKKI